MNKQSQPVLTLALNILAFPVASLQSKQPMLCQLNVFLNLTSRTRIYKNTAMAQPHTGGGLLPSYSD